MRISKEMLRKLVKEEHAKMVEVEAGGEKPDAPKEVEPGDEANTLEKHINVAKALKIKEGKIQEAIQKLNGQLKLVQERRKRVISKLVEN